MFRSIEFPSYTVAFFISCSGTKIRKHAPSWESCERKLEVSAIT